MVELQQGWVGGRRARFDTVGRVRGLVSHVGDQPIGTGAHVAVHRSTQPHALIGAVHTEDALALPGVYAVVTGADLYKQLGDRLLTGPAFADQPGLAHEKVRYVGEPVAAVLAVDLATARAAADAVWVDYEELPPVYDLAAALAGTAFVHDELRPSSVFGDLRHLRGVRDTNVNYEYHLRHGDAAAARDAGATTVTGEFWAPPTHHVSIELPCTIAWVDSGRLEMLTTTQTPSYVRQTIADLLDLPLSRVRVTTRQLGGSFGAKMYDRLEPLAAALAWTTGRKVRIVASREESFLLTTRHGAGVTSSLTADADGNLVSAIADVRYDTGAYADVGPRITAKSGMVAPGPYRIANASVRSRCVYTNKPSAGPFRGFGVPQVTWSHESLIDELAHSLGEDPYDVPPQAPPARGRRGADGHDHAQRGLRHLPRQGRRSDRLVRAAGPGDRSHPAWPGRRGRREGRADAHDRERRAAAQPGQLGDAVDQHRRHGTGQRHDHGADRRRRAAYGLAPDPRRARGHRRHPVRHDHRGQPLDLPHRQRRAAGRGSHAGQADRARGRAFRRHGRADRPRACRHTERTVSVQELVHGHFGARGATLTTEANFTSRWTPYDKETGRSEKVTEHWFAGAVGVRIAVDTATGRVHLEHLAVAGDVGRAINPALVEQQLSGAAIMGIGHALFDQLVLDQGQLVNGTLLDYQLPSVRDLPDELTPIIVESPHDTGPFGAKGVGETGILGVAPAIANAVRDAVGVRLTTLPMTPESVVAALEERS